MESWRQTWNITLNKYQRDNLLLVLNLIGYGMPSVEPFGVLNNGDWVGEIAWKLADQNESIIAEYPNMSYDHVKQTLEKWNRA